VTTHGSDESPRRADTESGIASAFGAGLLRRLVRGVVGGLIATALMTLYRFPVFRALPPTSEFWAKYVGGGATERYPGIGLVLHFLYGGVAGGLFGVLIDALGFETEREDSLGVIALSFAYSLALSVFGTRFVFRFLLDEDLDPDEAVIFHVGHAIYGLTLGTWVGFDRRTGEAYE